MRSSAVLLAAIVAHASAACVSGPISGTSCIAECGVDRFGGDYASVSDSTFESCTQACNGDARCVTAQFVISTNTCYLKYYKTDPSSNGNVNGVVCGGPSTTTTTASTTASATTTSAATSPSCVNGAVVSGTDGCVAECGTDHFGGDYTNVIGTTFQECALLCSSDSRCVTAQFAVSSSTCYLKSFETTASSNPDVNGVVCPANGASTSMTTSTTTTATAMTPSTTSTTTSAATTTTSSVPGSQVCTILRGQDRYGGNYAQINTGSFDACVGLCQADSQCVTAQYQISNGNCYLKSVRNPLSDNGDVDTADCSAVPVTTTTSATTMTTTTTSTTPTTTTTASTTTTTAPTTMATTTAMTTTTTTMTSTTFTTSTTTAAGVCSLDSITDTSIACMCTFDRSCNADSGNTPALLSTADNGIVCSQGCNYYHDCGGYVFNAATKSCAMYATDSGGLYLIKPIPGTNEVGLRSSCTSFNNEVCQTYTPASSKKRLVSLGSGPVNEEHSLLALIKAKAGQS